MGPRCEMAVQSSDLLAVAGSADLIEGSDGPLTPASGLELLDRALLTLIFSYFDTGDVARARVRRVSLLLTFFLSVSARAHSPAISRLQVKAWRFCQLKRRFMNLYKLPAGGMQRMEGTSGRAGHATRDIQTALEALTAAR